MRVHFFGEPWPTADERAPICEDDAYRVDVPVGHRCIRCEKGFDVADRGIMTAATPDLPLTWTTTKIGGLPRTVCAYHLGCFLIETLGPDVSRVVTTTTKGSSPMAADKLTIEIKLGNDAMCTGEDVGAKLNQLADLFAGFGPNLRPGERAIMDLNGNTVGSWKVT